MSGQQGTEGAPGSVDGVRAARIENTGRIVSVWAPVAVAVVVASHHSAPRALLLVVVLGVLWYACIEIGVMASRTTLATLGPRLPAFRGTFLALVVSTAFAVWVPSLSLGIGTNLALAGAVFVTVSGWDTIVARYVARPTRLLLVGPAEACINVIRELADGDGARFCLVGIVDDRGPQSGTSSLVLGTTAQMRSIIDRARPDLVALAPGCDRPATFTQLIDSASAGFRVLELAQFYEYAFGRVPVRDLTRAWFMSVLHLYQRPYAQVAKRASDLLGAGLLLTLSAPLFPLLVLFVRCTRGPVFIRQVRVGEHGRLFTMYKFRTMRADAEAPGEAVWAAAKDPRVTSAGRIMRRLRLDELPQLWNVIKGEMSIVGPRPERPEFIDELFESVPFWGRRHLVKPGITGWAQVKRGYTADAEGSLEKLSYDLWYIRHRSLAVDLAICARTLAAVLRGEPEAAARVVETDDLDPIEALLHHQQSGQREPKSLTAEA